MSPELRKVRLLDHDLLFQIYCTSRADEMAMMPWPDEQKSQFLAMQFDAQTRDYTGRYGTDGHSIIRTDRDIGRLWVYRGPDEIRLVDITLLPAHRGRGVGRQLIEQLQAEASAADLPLRLSVWQTNPGARRLYDRLGFVAIEDIGGSLAMQWQDRRQS